MTTSQTTSQTALLAALLGGSLAMIGGLLSGWLNNRLGEKRDQRRYKQEQDMALEARRQERLQQAYIELLRYLSPYADWAKSAQRLLGKPPAIPDLPPGEELKLVEALVEAYGSPEVRQLLREWRKHAAKLQYADEGLQPVGFDDKADADEEAWTPDMAAHRKATLKADREIRDRIRQELAGEA